MKGLTVLLCALFVFALTSASGSDSKASALAQASADVQQLEQMLRKHPTLTSESFREIETLSIQASLNIEAAKHAGANTKVLEQMLEDMTRELHKRHVDGTLKDMEAYAKLVPGVDRRLGWEFGMDVQFWRWAFDGARKAGVTIAPEIERRRKELEVTAFEQQAEHALKEYADFIACRPSRFASKGRIYGWNVWWDALYEQTRLPVMVAWALDGPNALRIKRTYDDLTFKLSEKFPFGNTGRKYGEVCGKELEQHRNTPSK